MRLEDMGFGGAGIGVEVPCFGISCGPSGGFDVFEIAV